MKILIEFTTDNAAFTDGMESARIIREVADAIEVRGDEFGRLLLRDVNGNSVGIARTVKSSKVKGLGD